MTITNDHKIREQEKVRDFLLRYGSAPKVFSGVRAENPCEPEQGEG